MISLIGTKRFFRTLMVLGIIVLVVSVQAGSISAERVATSASVSGNGAVSGTSVSSSGSTMVSSVSVSGEVSTGSDPASFSYSNKGADFAADPFIYVGSYASRVSVSGSIRGSGSASANATVYAEGGEDSLPDPDTIWLNTYILAETHTTANSPGSRATASASANGYAGGNGEWDGVGEISSSVRGSVSASSNARSSTVPSTSSGIAMLGSAATLSSDGASDVDAHILSLTEANGDNAGATATANGIAVAGSGCLNSQSAHASGRATGTSTVRNNGTAGARAELAAGADPTGSTSMISGSTNSDSAAPSFSGSGSASASGSAMTTTTNHSSSSETFTESTRPVTASGSQSGAGQVLADSLIIATVDHPEEGFDWNFDVTPSGYIPKTGLFVDDLDADLSVKSALMNSASLIGTSSGFRGSASSSVNGEALSTTEKEHELLSVVSEGSGQVRNSVRRPGFADGESGIMSVLFRNIQTGTAGAYLGPDSISIPVAGSASGSMAGGSMLTDQFSAQGSEASSSGSVQGSARSTGSGTNVTTSSRSDGTLSGSVSTTNSAGANTAALLGSVHAAGLEGPGFSNSLFDASVLVSESNAADMIDTTGTATGTVTGKTKATSEQFEQGVQKYSSVSAVDGRAMTSTRAQKGTGLAVAGLGSVSLVQPVLNPGSPDAFVKNAEGGASYAIARGEDPTARVTSSSEVRGTGSGGGAVNFYASGADPFTLTGNGQLTISTIRTAVEARTKNESEAIGFGFTAQRASLTGTNGVSEGIAGFGTGTAGSDNASVKADAVIDRIDLSNLARVDTTSSSIIPSNISVTFGNAASVSTLNPLKNIATTDVSIQSVVIEFNPDPGAGGTAWGTLIRSVKAITNENPNVAEGYYEGIASSNGEQPGLDLNLTPLLVGVYP